MGARSIGSLIVRPVAAVTHATLPVPGIHCLVSFCLDDFPSSEADTLSVGCEGQGPKTFPACAPRDGRSISVVFYAASLSFRT
jgi:hypothetical protein